MTPADLTAVLDNCVPLPMPRCGVAEAGLAIPTFESAPRSLPSVAVPSAQVIATLNPIAGVGGEFTSFY